MWSRFKLFIHLPNTAPSSGHPTLFQYLSVIFWSMRNNRYAFLPSRSLGIACSAFYHFSLYVPLAVIAILPIEPLAVR